MQFFEFDWTDTSYPSNVPTNGHTTEWKNIFSRGAPQRIMAGEGKEERIGNKIICKGIDLRGLFTVPAGNGVNDDTYWTIHCIRVNCSPDELLEKPNYAVNYADATAAINGALWDEADITAGGWAGLYHRNNMPKLQSHRRKIWTVFKKRFIIHQERPALNDNAKLYFKFFVKQNHPVEYMAETGAPDEYEVIKGQYYISIYPDEPTTLVAGVNQVVLRSRWYWRSSR